MEYKPKEEGFLRIVVAIGGALAAFFLLQIIKTYAEASSPPFWQGIGLLIGINMVVVASLMHRRKDSDAERTQLLQSVNTKTEFVIYAAHQLRTPITSIRWEAETLRKKKGLAKDVAKTLEEIEAKSKRLSELVNALLNMAKLDTRNLAGEPEKTDLVTLMKEAIHEVQLGMSKKHLSHKAKYESGECVIMTHPKLMKIVFSNILENAVQYSKNKGTIETSIEEGKDTIVIRIKDNGIGIPKDDMEYIFNKLYRASNAVQFVPEGNGIGLYMTKAIIDSMDGKIEINSEVDQGTEVIISLPGNLRASN